MAIITCTECGQELTLGAKICPNCGAPVENVVGNMAENLKSTASDTAQKAKKGFGRWSKVLGEWSKDLGRGLTAACAAIPLFGFLLVFLRSKASNTIKLAIILSALNLGVLLAWQPFSPEHVAKRDARHDVRIVKPLYKYAIKKCEELQKEVESVEMHGPISPDGNMMERYNEAMQQSLSDMQTIIDYKNKIVAALEEGRAKCKGKPRYYKREVHYYSNMEKHERYLFAYEKYSQMYFAKYKTKLEECVNNVIGVLGKQMIEDETKSFMIEMEQSQKEFERINNIFLRLRNN